VRKKKIPQTEMPLGLLVPPETKFIGVRLGDNVLVGYGVGENADAWVDDAKPVPHVQRHSPDGFEWGYEGSGPADLALSILTLAFGPAVGNAYYEQFKRDCIAKQPKEGVFIEARSLIPWLARQMEHEWVRRVIEKGKDKGTVLPERCAKCGAARRKDDRNGVCLGRGRT